MEPHVDKSNKEREIDRCGEMSESGRIERVLLYICEVKGRRLMLRGASRPGSHFSIFVKWKIYFYFLEILFIVFFYHWCFRKSLLKFISTMKKNVYSRVWINFNRLKICIKMKF